MAKKPINYTSRDFESIKGDLVNYAKRYYPTTFKDFNEASFGALMMDLVAYVGDQLSFYADYQTNESFLDSAIEFGNIVRLAESMGYKYPGSPQSTGQCSFYVIVPANTNTRGPDLNYLPIMEAGTLLGSAGGGTFTLVENVDFTNPNNKITVARVDSTSGNPTYFAVKAFGQVVSGQRYKQIITVGDYQRFLRLKLDKSNITDIISIVDSQGSEYYEVAHLSQDIIFKELVNTDSTRTAVPYVMRTVPAPRRFVIDRDVAGNTYIQFGYGSENNITTNIIADPASVTLNVSGRNYISDRTFDPTKLIESDKFGVVPVNTVLSVEYTSNSTATVNAPVGAITSVVNPTYRFQNQASLSQALVTEVIASLEVENESPILGDTSPLTPEEIRTQAFGSHAAQNRAVTRNDYINLSYRMPAKFGKIKRVNVVRDQDSVKRNLNIYTLSENHAGDFTIPNTILKENLKQWLTQYRMINDTLDILDGRIINIGINFEVLPELSANRYEVLQSCVEKLKNEYLNVKFGIGEAIYISEVYKLLNDVPGVVDTMNVEITNKTTTGYSEYQFDILENMSDDGRFLKIPEDAVAEVLYPNIDVSGVVR
tara:strand:- start:4783 stop:6576 length:1794 start_codon:yes stop_codon:yes gene_type:complete